jgi:single-strand DNA-binding protein
VVADEVGPSIRWATAQVTKNERRGPVEGGGGNAGGGGGRPAAPSGGNAGEAAGYGYSEEPF